jgi:hypothetical protein
MAIASSSVLYHFGPDVPAPPPLFPVPAKVAVPQQLVQAVEVHLHFGRRRFFFLLGLQSQPFLDLLSQE